MQTRSSFRLAALAGAVFLASCGGSDDPAPAPEETRPQDARTFTLTAETTFPALAAAAVTWERGRHHRWAVRSWRGLRSKCPQLERNS